LPQTLLIFSEYGYISSKEVYPERLVIVRSSGCGECAGRAYYVLRDQSTLTDSQQEDNMVLVLFEDRGQGTRTMCVIDNPERNGYCTINGFRVDDSRDEAIALGTHVDLPDSFCYHG
jgi:hypothetical protein